MGETHRASPVRQTKSLSASDVDLLEIPPMCHVSVLRPRAQKLSGGRVTLQTRRRVNGKRAGHCSRTIMPTASFVKFSVDSHMMTMCIESWAHMGNLTRKFRAHAYTSVWLERLKRRAKYRRWDAVTVPGKEACQGSRWNGPESAHALAHRRCHRPC